jgi:hypothetical protein
MTALLAGGCGIVWIVDLIQNQSGYKSLAWIPLLVGGIPVFIGYQVFKAGRRIIRSQSPHPEPTDTPDTQR